MNARTDTETDTETDLGVVRGFLLDLDGTLYVGGRLLEGTRRFLSLLRERALPFLCLTNNSSARKSDYVAKLATMGLDMAPTEVMTSGEATIDHLLATTEHRSAYVVGTPALRAEFEDAGIGLSDDDPDCLVVGYDTTVDYAKLEVATRLLFAGKPYFATHPDRTCISDRGLLPDIAATIAGLEAVTDRLPVIVGKPERAIVDAAAGRLGLPIEDLAMVGDQLDTDITMARRHGLVAVLVMSGETSGEKLRLSPVKPDIVVEHVGELEELLRAGSRR